jgi:p-cumate 2,3-dioxygenase subunit beta
MITIVLPSPQEVEDLLYREAALLDEWRLEEWLEMLTDD